MKTVFADINKKIEKNINETISAHNIAIGKLLLKIEVIQQAGNIVKSNCNAVIEEVENDITNSIIFMAQAFYRNSMMCLRSALELSLSYIYYHDHNHEYILWKNNRFDMSWAKLFSSDTGVINSHYLDLFISGQLKIDELREKIKNSYHSCSEYVHGKYMYMQSINEVNIIYEKKAVEEYFEQANNITDIMILLLFIRFGREYDLRKELDDTVGIWNPIIKKYGGEW